jgi:hypothetical protein
MGIAVCRIPRASPRCEPGNHAITARPLADWTLAPRNPASTSKSNSSSNVPAREAPRRAKPQPPTPARSTHRSPIRSAASPHGISDTTEPASEAEMSTPVWPSDRWKSSRSDGAITATPNQIAE